MKKPVALLSFFGITIFILISFSCKKECTCGMSNAEIIGYDYRECVCCGGLELVIDNVTPPQGSQFFIISEIPSSYQIGNNPQFPIAVKIDYNIDTTFCDGNFVKITRIANR
jgi:hypothetical protein